MASEEEDFLSAIERRPEDHGLKLVYADWLDERAARSIEDGDRAELLRRKVEEKRFNFLSGTRWGNSWRDEGYRTWYLERFVDHAWLTRAIDPPVPLATRASRTWLAALFGGEPERTELGADAPPALTEDALLDDGLLWGWPSAALFQMAFLAARDAVEVVAASAGSRMIPRAALLRALDHVAGAHADGLEAVHLEGISTEGLPQQDSGPPHFRKSRRIVAIRAALDLPGELVDILGAPYQTLAHNSRVDCVMRLFRTCRNARIGVAASAFGFQRAQDRQRATAAQAKAAFTRAEKAAIQLRVRMDRVEAFGGEARALKIELTNRLARARAIAEDAKAIAERASSERPPAPDIDAETRVLFQRIAPDMLTWLRTTELVPEPLVVSQPAPIDEPYRKAEYREDGRMRYTW